jgi:ribosomal protein S27AE
MNETDRSRELERFAVQSALRAAWTTELWIPADPDYGFVDYFEAAAARNLGLLGGFEELAEDVDRRGILPQSDSDQSRLVTDGGQVESDPERCWRCGRAASMATSKDEYLFGIVCDRADCKRVKQAFLDEYKRFWAAASLPVDGPGSGRPSAWSPDGRITSCGALDGDGQVAYPTPGTMQVCTDGGQVGDGADRSTHLGESGLWIPPELREFQGQIVFRTPRSTIQHFQSGGGQMDGYYGLIDESHFGAPDEFRDPNNPDLAPDRVSIKPQGENAVVLDVDLNAEVRCDGGTSHGYIATAPKFRECDPIYTQSYPTPQDENPNTEVRIASWSDTDGNGGDS